MGYKIETAAKWNGFWVELLEPFRRHKGIYADTCKIRLLSPNATGWDYTTAAAGDLQFIATIWTTNAGLITTSAGVLYGTTSSVILGLTTSAVISNLTVIDANLSHWTPQTTDATALTGFAHVLTLADARYKWHYNEAVLIPSVYNRFDCVGTATENPKNYSALVATFMSACGLAIVDPPASSIFPYNYEVGLGDNAALQLEKITKLADQEIVLKTDGTVTIVANDTGSEPSIGDGAKIPIPTVASKRVIPDRIVITSFPTHAVNVTDAVLYAVFKDADSITTSAAIGWWPGESTVAAHIVKPFDARFQNLGLTDAQVEDLRLSAYRYFALPTAAMPLLPIIGGLGSQTTAAAHLTPTITHSRWRKTQNGFENVTTGQSAIGFDVDAAHGLVRFAEPIYTLYDTTPAGNDIANTIGIIGAASIRFAYEKKAGAVADYYTFSAGAGTKIQTINIPEFLALYSDGAAVNVAALDTLAGYITARLLTTPAGELRKDQLFIGPHDVDLNGIINEVAQTPGTTQVKIRREPVTGGAGLSDLLNFVRLGLQHISRNAETFSTGKGQRVQTPAGEMPLSEPGRLVDIGRPVEWANYRRVWNATGAPRIPGDVVVSSATTSQGALQVIAAGADNTDGALVVIEGGSTNAALKVAVAGEVLVTMTTAAAIAVGSQVGVLAGGSYKAGIDSAGKIGVVTWPISDNAAYIMLTGAQGAGGGGMSTHGATHMSGGADAVYFQFLQHNSTDATTHDNFTTAPHVAAAWFSAFSAASPALSATNPAIGASSLSLRTQVIEPATMQFSSDASVTKSYGQNSFPQSYWHYSAAGAGLGVWRNSINVLIDPLFSRWTTSGIAIFFHGLSATNSTKLAVVLYDTNGNINFTGNFQNNAWEKVYLPYTTSAPAVWAPGLNGLLEITVVVDGAAAPAEYLDLGLVSISQVCRVQ